MPAKNLIYLGLLGALACSKSSPKNVEATSINNEISSPNDLSIPNNGDLPQTDLGSTQNTQPAQSLLDSIEGAWSSICRDLESTIKNASEKDIIILETFNQTNTIRLFTLRFEGTRSCDYEKFTRSSEDIFVIHHATDGHSERDSALALDLINENQSIEKPQNVLLLLASQQNSSKKGRILFEILDSQRASIRLNIQEWSDLLNNLNANQEAVLLELNKVSNDEKQSRRRTIPYTQAQAFSPASSDDLDLIQD